MKIISKLFVAIGLCAGSFGVFANEQVSNEREFQLASGIGLHYGGLLGLQFGSVTEDDRYYAALALFGGAIGYDWAIDEDKKHSLGVSGGRYSGLLTRSNFLSLNYSNHVTGFSNRGWQYGINLAYTTEIEDGQIFSSKEGSHDSKVLLTISAGFKF